MPPETSTEQALTALVRRRLLAGSDRALPVDAPIGRLGLGLDSLALVRLLAAIEEECGVVLEDELWADRDGLTVAGLARRVERARASTGRGGADEPGAPRILDRPVVPRFAEDFEREPQPAATSLLRTAAHAVAGRLRVRLASFHVLGKLLQDGSVPDIAPGLPVAFREAVGEERRRTAVSWGASRDYFERWVASDAICLIAEHEGELVAFDWIAPSPVFDHMLALRVQVGPGDCFGMGLFEHPDYRGRGVGLALLARSVGEMARRGFRRQTTIVDVKNIPMLSAAVHILGFSRLGGIRMVRVSGRTWSRWQLGDRRGFGGTLPV